MSLFSWFLSTIKMPNLFSIFFEIELFFWLIFLKGDNFKIKKSAHVFDKTLSHAWTLSSFCVNMSHSLSLSRNGILSGSKWIQMAPNGSKWQMAPHGSKRLQMALRAPNAPNGSKFIQMTPNGSKRFQITTNDSKWLQMPPYSSKWLQMA